ncbi:hypothetical protein Leryth_006910 [Lithospermum erythrorhizon]|nr:hypothetical protein Leryth_006910 [Lithospermum erythrorhizon]
MGKQKQQIISRFFSTKPKQEQQPQPTTNATVTPPKISTTATFSPSKRLRATQLTSPQTNKLPKLDKPSLNPTLHEKFLNRLFEIDQESLEISKNASKCSFKYTPLEEQVVELKKKYPDVLLMIEVGYKYRFFGEDAENAARVLGIFAHMDHSFLTASVPTFRLNVHVRRLVSEGYKVGVVKQTETAAIKAHGGNKLGPFSRGLSALYTKATLEAGENLGGGEEGCGQCNNYLVCVVENKVKNVEQGMRSGVDVKIGVVGVEVSTGDVVFGEFDDDFMRASLEAVILNLSPAELLIEEPLSKQTEKLLLAYAGPASHVRVERTSRACFYNGGALAQITSVYQNISESSSSEVHQEEDGLLMDRGSSHLAIQGIMAMPDMAVEALALIIRHLKQFGLEKMLCLGASFRPLSGNMEITLSANALQQLEVLKNNSDGTESGSLLACMNNTITIFGSRLLRHWVTHPLRDQEMIISRLDAVSEIAESMAFIESSLSSAFDGGESGVTSVQPELHQSISSVLISLGRSPDIQRGITRIFHQTATASEFIAVIQAFLIAGKQLQNLCVENECNTKSVTAGTVRSKLLRKSILAVTSSGVIDTSAKILSTLNKEAADQRDHHNLFNVSDGKFAEVAEARMKVEVANEKLDLLISEYRKQLNIRSLEFTSVSGVTHLIELPPSVRVPNSWVRVNSTKKTIRYHPPEVLAALDQLSLANEKLTLICRAAWNNFLKEFGVHFPEFQAAVQALATLDCLHSLAVLSRNKNYVRPDFVCNDEPVQIDICSGRHPIMETILQDNFVPNDTNLHAEREYCQIVTGPNMGGKSCYIRQVALITIMAQVAAK